MSPEKQTLPTGYILRKGTSKDKLKIKNKIYFEIYCSSKALGFVVSFIIVLTLLVFFLSLFFHLIYYKYKVLMNQFFFNELKIFFIQILGIITLATIATITLAIALAYLFLHIFSWSKNNIFPPYKSNERNFPFWVIEKDRNLVGLIELGKFKGISCISFLFVLRNYRRRGLGSTLVKHLLQNANKPVVLSCSSELIQFYTRLGFIQSGTPVRWGGKQIITMVYGLPTT